MQQRFPVLGRREGLDGRPSVREAVDRWFRKWWTSAHAGGLRARRRRSRKGIRARHGRSWVRKYEATAPGSAWR